MGASRPVLLTAAYILSGRGAWERSISPARSEDKNLSSVFCHLSFERGISLIELIMFIVILSVGLAGIMLAMDVSTKSSGDPVIRKQALTVAESLLEEIELQSFAVIANAAGRENYNDIFDYNGLAGAVTHANSSVAVTGLENYSITAQVAILSSSWGGVPAASAAQITVTVNGPGGQSIEMAGYKVAH
ncbi:MAG: hypothetical protein WAW10_01235 [Gallionella sp.]